MELFINTPQLASRRGNQYNYRIDVFQIKCLCYIFILKPNKDRTVLCRVFRQTRYLFDEQQFGWLNRSDCSLRAMFKSKPTHSSVLLFRLSPKKTKIKLRIGLCSNIFANASPRPVTVPR